MGRLDEIPDVTCQSFGQTASTSWEGHDLFPLGIVYQSPEKDLSNSMAVDTEVLLRHIEAAFGRMTYPGDEQIVADNSGWDLDYERPKRLLRGRHWRDVTFDILNKVKSSLSFLSPEGFRFYLPGLMVLTIKDIERADVLPDAMISELTRPRVSDLDTMREWVDAEAEELDGIALEDGEWLLHWSEENYYSGNAERSFFERVSGFDRAQSNVIREFLEYLQSVYPLVYENREPAIAIERYWHQFAGDDTGHEEGCQP